jgi:subtilisin family serine protease
MAKNGLLRSGFLKLGCPAFDATRRLATPILLALTLGWANAQMPAAYREDRIIIKPVVPLERLNNLHAQIGSRVLKRFQAIGNIVVLELPRGVRALDAVAAFQQSGMVEYAEPDYYFYTADVFPNDPSFWKQWGLHNTGQTGGLNDADIDAPEGWGWANSAPSKVVAVIDTGVRYTHEDLAANMWRNPGESGGGKETNLLDDDGNGYVDDVYGINTVADPTTGDPMDDSAPIGHGTHVAGIIGAVGNNSKGVTGVAWGVKIMALKSFNAAGQGSDSDIEECIDYALQMGVNVLNLSWGWYAYSLSLRDALNAARNYGALCAAAAGNYDGVVQGYDNDARSPFYPASFELDNIVAVAATTSSDLLASYSYYGLVRVHLGAPGGEKGPNLQDPSTWTNAIYSTGATNDTDYRYLVGTSMATPHVSGALALLWYWNPVVSYLHIKNRLLSSTDPLPSLAGKCQTGGRLNLYKALTSANARPPNDAFANAFTLSANSGLIFVGNNVEATKETGEPNHAGNSGGKSVWWKWTAPSSSPVAFTTINSGFDTLLAVYTGSSVSSLTQVAANRGGGYCDSSWLTFTPAAGTTYRVAVDGYNGACGTIKLLWTADTTPPPSEVTLDASSIIRDRPNGTYRFVILGPPLAYVIPQKAPDLNNWIDLPGVILNSLGWRTFTDASATGHVGFYRASDAYGRRSCNTIGYVDRTLPNGDSLNSNPLLAMDNRVSALFPDGPEAVNLYKWNEASQSWIINTYWAGAWTDPNMTLLPGEGFLFRQLTGGPLIHTFVGEIPQGFSVNPVPNLFSLRSSIPPLGGLLALRLRFPVLTWDYVLRMENGSYVTYSFTNSAWTPQEPVVSLGESFFSYKNVGFWWYRNFMTWP